MLNGLKPNLERLTEISRQIRCNGYFVMGDASHLKANKDRPSDGGGQWRSLSTPPKVVPKRSRSEDEA